MVKKKNVVKSREFDHFTDASKKANMDKLAGKFVLQAFEDNYYDLVLGATRYYMGRKSIQTSRYIRSLINAVRYLPIAWLITVRQVLMNDLCRGSLPLYDQWKKVLDSCEEALALKG